MKKFSIGIVAVVLMAGMFSSSLLASVLEIQMTGLDMVYDGSRIVDAVSVVGGTGNPADADRLDGVFYLKEGMLADHQVSNIYLDMRFEGVSGIPAGGGQVTSTGNGDTFGFDLLTSPGIPAWGLKSNVDKCEVWFTNMGSVQILLGQCLVTSVPVQELPFGLELDVTKPISVFFASQNIRNITLSGGYVTGFEATGFASIKGTLIPEPATILLVLGGIVGTRLVRRKTRQQ